jgi:uncharacterized sporulation protein YeaH/YhbH (DUF444 family)
MQIVDRRLNPTGRSLPNRQRFLRRAKGTLQREIGKSGALGKRSLSDQGGHEIEIPLDGLGEPQFHHGPGGIRDRVLPGNKKYLEGDKISRPQGGKGGGGSQGSPDGAGLDNFRFTLTREEFLSLLFDDLELPDMAKQALADTENPALVRAGYQSTGNPSALSVVRTMRNSLARRIALRRPRPEEIAALEKEIAALEGQDDAAARLRLVEACRELTAKQARINGIPFIDPIDVCFRRFEPKPKPEAQAVMFCLMDVSGSMTEDMKDMAKRFYLLLHLFLERRYKKVELVFIRHTQTAEAVSEQKFFYEPVTGGTVVSSALALMQQLIKDKYSPASWNIYAAQASDGDNASNDGRETTRLLEALLPQCQYFAYLEVGRASSYGGVPVQRPPTDLWRTYSLIADGLRGRLNMRQANHRNEIFPVFRELFARKDVTAHMAAVMAPGLG